MKRTFLYTLVGLLSLTACESDEGPLQPSGNYSVLRFDFPQGNNPWDDDIVDIHDEYGTYVIYKDITDQDINRQWQSLGTGTPQTCDPVPAEDVQYYVDFFKNHVLGYVSPEAAKLALPVKVYFVENMRDIESGTGSGTGGSTSNDVVSVKIDGFDYWSLSFKRDDNGELPKDDQTLRYARCKFIYTIIKAAYVNNLIEEDMDVRAKLDTKTPLKYKREDRGKPDYKWTRGYADRVSEGNFSEVEYVVISNSVKGNSAYDVEFDYFLSYCRLAMYYGREYVENKYKKYPLVLEVYNDIVAYMMDKYGIDLEGIYYGPDGEQ